MAETPEMESPSARQDCFVEAQEDSTSVEAKAEGGTTSTTITSATTDTDDDDDAVRSSIVQDSREDLVMVCERLDERLENEGSEARQSSDKPEKDQDEKEKEEKEANMGLMIAKKANEDEKNEKDEIGVKSTEDSLHELKESPRTLDSQNRNIGESSEVWENGIEKSRSLDVSRKRPATGDFLPIGAEIKRIGIEISEEQATQLRNDVRRLSPVLVSLRERTLGEVSLTSESCLFGEELDGRITPRCNDVSTGSFVANDSKIQDVAKNRGKQNVGEKETIDRISAECTSSDNIENTLNSESKKMECDSKGEIMTLDVEVASSIFSKSDNLDGTTESRQDDIGGTNMATNAGSEPCSPTKKCIIESTSLTVPSSPICRNLTIMLNRIENDDLRKKRALINTNIDENIWDYVVKKSSPYFGGRRDFVEEVRDSFEETSEAQEKSPKKQRLQGSSSPMTRSKKWELTESACSPDNGPVLKKCKVVLERIGEVMGHSSQSENAEDSETLRELEKDDESAPVAMIGKLEEDEEVILASSSPTAEDSRVSNELDSSETMPSSPEETPEVSADVAEGVDTETETETGSDSSEVSPITSIRHELRDVDMAPDQLPCSEGVALCCVEAMAPIITRLEADRPEAYTEDSAESLALATGARDEVRSDGSDSGLGNEIPGDPGPAPAPESDSETSFLDRLPDDILSDKEKGKKRLLFQDFC